MIELVPWWRLVLNLISWAVLAAALFVAWREFHRVVSIVIVAMVGIVFNGVLVPISAIGYLWSRRGMLRTQMKRSIVGPDDREAPG